MKLITISGLDGSGKSTQIKMLKNYLEQSGSKVFYFHAVEFSLANKFFKKKNGGGKSVTKANSFQIWLRKMFLKIDIWRFKLLLNKLSNNYDYILSDRYFYDSVVNIEYLHSLLTSNVRNFLTLDVRRPDLAIYLQVSPHIIMQRERKPDQGLEYLKTKKELYDASANNWNMRIIDGNRNKEDIHKEIIKIINS